MSVAREATQALRPCVGTPPSWACPAPPMSPCRERGYPPHNKEQAWGAPSPEERARRRPRSGGTRGSCSRWQVGGPGPLRSRSYDGKDREEDDEEGAIEEYFGQLWFLPSHPQSAASRSRPRVPDGGDRVRNRVWIRKDLWERREFDIEDCYPASEKVKWSEPPVKLRFAEDIWGKGVRESFVSKLKSAMAGRGRGRGPPRPHSPEEWNCWGADGTTQVSTRLPLFSHRRSAPRCHHFLRWRHRVRVLGTLVVIRLPTPH